MLVTSVQAMRRRVRLLARDYLALAAVLVLVVLVAATLLAPWLTHFDPTKMNVPDRLKSPGAGHLLGTDRFGRDLLARILFGMRVTLGVGVLSVGIGMTAGLALGTVAGYYRRLTDWIMRPMEVVMSFPPILLAIAIVATLGQSLGTLIIAISIVQVPYFAVMARNLVRGQHSLDYVEAAVSIGARDSRLLWRHVLPNISPSMLVYFTIRLGTAVLTISYLSFLGLGPSPPTPELGLIVSEGREQMFDHPYLVAFPSVFLFAMVLSINLIGDALRDLLDPRGALRR